MEILQKIKKFLVSPNEAFKAEKKSKFLDGLKYSLIGLVFLAALASIVAAIMQPELAAVLVTVTAPVIIIGGLCFQFIFGAWLHLWVYILGGREGIANTIRTLFYANTPSYYLSWIPLVGLLAKLWSVVLVAIGLSHFQKLSTGRAVGAVVLAWVILLVVAVILLVWVMSILGPDIMAQMEQFSQLETTAL